MIEAPEALLQAEQLNETVRRKRITDVIARHTPHKFAWFHGDPDNYAELLGGRQVERSRAFGGHIEISAGDMRLLLSEGVNLRWYAPGERLPDKHQLLVAFDDESCLVASVRMYGGLMCFREGTLDGPFRPYYESAKAKPQVMSGAFDRAYFQRLADREGAAGKSAKAFLATGQTIPGLGNGVLQDILFRARIHPKTKTGDLAADRMNALFDSIVGVLGEMYRLGGRDSETDLFGRRGDYIPILSKNTLGRPCPRCGEPIRKETYLGGTVYYCPGCQPYRK